MKTPRIDILADGPSFDFKVSEMDLRKIDTIIAGIKPEMPQIACVMLCVGYVLGKAPKDASLQAVCQIAAKIAELRTAPNEAQKIIVPKIV